MLISNYHIEKKDTEIILMDFFLLSKIVWRCIKQFALGDLTNEITRLYPEIKMLEAQPSLPLV